MKFLKKLATALVIGILFIVPAAHADIVVFKSGNKVEVDKTWQEGEQICFLFHGVKARIPQSKIVRIESASKKRNKTFTLKKKRKSDLAEVVAGHTGDPDAMVSSTSTGAVISGETCPPLRKDGFCDLRWGSRVANVEGLERRKTTSKFEGVIEYVRSNDISKVGDATLRSIIYAFWQDKLYTVTIWTKGYSNYTALRDKVFKEFGPGRQIESTREKYLWSDIRSDIMLEYIEEGRFGMLWLRSKELDEQCRSSQLKGHASYLKWLKSRK